MKHLILFLMICSLLACSKSEEHLDTFLDCNQVGENYKTYHGENIECQLHYSLTEYKEEKFIELISHCSDLTRPIVIDENCKDICEILPYDENSECGKYIKERKVLKILFIEK